jgi:hypothetical protein
MIPSPGRVGVRNPDPCRNNRGLLIRDRGSQSVGRHEFVCRCPEEMPPKLRKLFARLSEGAIAHLGYEAGVVQRVSPLRRHLIDPPDRFAVMNVARDDLRGAERAVRLTSHEEPSDRCRHRQLAPPPWQLARLGDRHTRGPSRKR